MFRGFHLVFGKVHIDLDSLGGLDVVDVVVSTR